MSKLHKQSCLRKYAFVSLINLYAQRSRRPWLVLSRAALGLPAGHSVATPDRTRLGWHWGAGTRGLSLPLPHRPSASLSSSPSTPLQSSSLTSCTLSSRPLPLPLSLLRSQSWGGARPAVGQASMAGLSVPPLQFRSLGGPRVPCSLEPGRQGSLVCLVSGLLLCGEEASPTPEPS